MDFFDCNAVIGRPCRPGPSARLGDPSTDALRAEMQKAGIGRALVWHVAQLDAGPQVGNALLAQAISGRAELFGCWSVLPDATFETPPVSTFVSEMRKARIVAVKVSPMRHNFIACKLSLGKILGAMSERRVPVMISVTKDMGWRELYSLLEEFPKLTAVITDHGCWGQDRYFRPLLDAYPNVHVDISNYLLDGGIESLVKAYTSKRILFGTGYPDLYPGGMMLVLRHADISEEGKDNIAGENLQRLIEKVNLD